MQTYIPALVIIAISLVIALFILPFINGVIAFLTRKTQTDIDDNIRIALRKPIVYIALLIGIRIALDTLVISDTTAYIAHSLVYSLVIIVVAQAVVRVSTIVIHGLIHTPQIGSINEQTAPLFTNVTLGIVWAAALYALFLVWGLM